MHQKQHEQLHYSQWSDSRPEDAHDSDHCVTGRQLFVDTNAGRFVMMTATVKCVLVAVMVLEGILAKVREPTVFQQVHRTQAHQSRKGSVMLQGLWFRYTFGMV